MARHTAVEIARNNIQVKNYKLLKFLRKALCIWCFCVTWALKQIVLRQSLFTLIQSCCINTFPTPSHSHSFTQYVASSSRRPLVKPHMPGAGTRMRENEYLYIIYCMDHFIIISLLAVAAVATEHTLTIKIVQIPRRSRWKDRYTRMGKKNWRAHTTVGVGGTRIRLPPALPSTAPSFPLQPFGIEHFCLAFYNAIPSSEIHRHRFLFNYLTKVAATVNPATTIATITAISYCKEKGPYINIEI